jgi:asparagine N-glycosylation enzyme membrane subunit Stt3
METLNETKPKFFTRASIFIFSILLTVVFGALLFSDNLNEAGKRKEIYKIILLSIAWYTVLENILKRITHLSFVTSYLIINGIGGLMIAFPIWNNYLKEIEEFEKRKSSGPAIVFLVLLLFVLTGFILISGAWQRW